MINYADLIENLAAYYIGQAHWALHLSDQRTAKRLETTIMETMELKKALTGKHREINRILRRKEDD